MKNIPVRIFLQVGKNVDEDMDFDSLKDVTWSTDQIFKNDIEFIRLNDDQNVVSCPVFDKHKPNSILNPICCLVTGKCNYCTSFLNTECSGCRINIDKIF